MTTDCERRKNTHKKSGKKWHACSPMPFSFSQCNFFVFFFSDKFSILYFVQIYAWLDKSCSSLDTSHTSLKLSQKAQWNQSAYDIVFLVKTNIAKSYLRFEVPPFLFFPNSFRLVTVWIWDIFVCEDMLHYTADLFVTTTTTKLKEKNSKKLH